MIDMLSMYKAAKNCKKFISSHGEHSLAVCVCMC